MVLLAATVSIPIKEQTLHYKEAWLEGTNRNARGGKK